MCIPDFIRGMVGMILLEIFVAVVIVAVFSHSRKDKNQCEDTISEKE